VSKAGEAFRSIGEVAEELNVPKYVLRFWESKFPQVRPIKGRGGRRYYRPEDLELLRGIRYLLHSEGYAIRGVQKILRSQGIDQVKQSWRATS
jgi:DNA-binding transcriptional MerR regulator